MNCLFVGAAVAIGTVVPDALAFVACRSVRDVAVRTHRLVGLTEFTTGSTPVATLYWLGLSPFPSSVVSAYPSPLSLVIS